MAEEESLAGRSDFDQTEELRLLNEESELSIEELRLRYLCEKVNVEDNLPDLGQANNTTSSSKNTIKQSTNGKTTILTKSTEKSHSNLAYLTGSLSKADNEEGEDEDYSPPTENWKNVIRVGFAYQVL